MMINEEDTLRELAEQKEREWRSIQEKRIEALEASLRQKSHELADQKSKMSELRDDFKYNLKLLEERDRELEKFEQALMTSRKQLADKTAEVSELKIKLDEMRSILESEKNAVDECKKFYVNRLTQKNNEVDKYKAAKDAEINKERGEIEKFKRSMQTQVQDLEMQIEKQRGELGTQFDEIMRKREHEWRLQAEEFSSNIMARDLEIRMLKSELSQARKETDSIRSNVNEDEQIRRQLERKIKEKEWELKDCQALKDSKISDLENKLNALQASHKTAIDDLNRKNDELDRLVHEKHLMVENLKTSLAGAEATKSAFEQQISELKKKLNEAEGDTMRRTAGGGEQALLIELERLREEYRKQVEWNSKLSVRSEVVGEQTTREMETLRRKLAASQERVVMLETEMVRVNLEWQERYRHLEELKVKDSDLFNRQTLDAKNQALDRVRFLEEQLKHKENVIQALQTNENVVEQIVESNEFKLKEENEKLKSIIREMRQEMENLASGGETVAKSSEALLPSKQLSPPSPMSSAATTRPNEDTLILSKPKITIADDKIPSSDYVDDLKRQLLESKQKNRTLQSQIDQVLLTNKLPDTITDNTILNSHIKSINETVDILRKEKVDLTALAKKQQARLLHMEKLLGEQTEQNRQKQAAIDTLKYEMSQQTRRTSHEVESLKQTVAHLELELSATRREADEYHKASIERGSELAALETKISELKMKLSTAGTQLNFGAQELFIQQLQDEIKRLSGVNQQLQIRARQMHHMLMRQRDDQVQVLAAIGSKSATALKRHAPPPSSFSIDDPIDHQHQEEDAHHGDVSTLRVKLKTAAKYISHLIREKEHLIEMSNRLRGELNRMKYENESKTFSRLNRDAQLELDDLQRRQTAITTTQQPPSSSLTSPRTALSNQLQKLEKKQYELTKQQLAFQQAKNRAKSAPDLSRLGRNKSPAAAAAHKKVAVIETSSDDTMNSSVKSENLREIWKILEDENNAPIFDDDSTPTRDTPTNVPARGLVVTGVRPQSARKPATTSSDSKPLTTKSNIATTPSSIKKPSVKIRNYNVKD